MKSFVFFFEISTSNLEPCLVLSVSVVDEAVELAAQGSLGILTHQLLELDDGLKAFLIWVTIFGSNWVKKASFKNDSTAKFFFF